MKITILGCGSSSGVPIIGQPKPANPKNIRTRVSVHVETETANILIDTSPDLRQQALATGITKVDAVIYTHAHADHCHGIDDIKAFNYIQKKQIDAFGAEETMNELLDRFGYCFREPRPDNPYRPSLKSHIVKVATEFKIGGQGVSLIPQIHGGYMDSYGVRIGNFAYTTDVKSFPPAAIPYLKNLDLWIVDCLMEQESPTHSHLTQTLEWIELYKPKRAILTHMNYKLDYDFLSRTLPDGVEPAYDGLTINLKTKD